MRAGDVLGRRSTVGHRDVLAGEPVVDGDARGPDGDERRLVVGRGPHEQLGGPLADGEALDLPGRRCRRGTAGSRTAWSTTAHRAGWRPPSRRPTRPGRCRRRARRRGGRARRELEATGAAVLGHEQAEQLEIGRMREPSHRSFLAKRGSTAPIGPAYAPRRWPSSTTWGSASPTSSDRAASTRRCSGSPTSATCEVPDAPASTAAAGARAGRAHRGVPRARRLRPRAPRLRPRGQRPHRERSFTEPGLTHISFSVDDIPATCRSSPSTAARSSPTPTWAAMAINVRDPDGQILELLPMSYRTG